MHHSSANVNRCIWTLYRDIDPGNVTFPGFSIINLLTSIKQVSLNTPSIKLSRSQEHSIAAKNKKNLKLAVVGGVVSRLQIRKILN